METKLKKLSLIVTLISIVFLSGCIEQNGGTSYLTASQVYETDLNNQYSYGDEVYIQGVITNLAIVGGAGRMYLDNVDGLHLCYSMSEYYDSFEEGQIVRCLIKRSSSKFYWGIVEVK